MKGFFRLNSINETKKYIQKEFVEVFNNSYLNNTKLCENLLLFSENCFESPESALVLYNHLYKIALKCRSANNKNRVCLILKECKDKI